MHVQHRTWWHRSKFGTAARKEDCHMASLYRNKHTMSNPLQYQHNQSDQNLRIVRQMLRVDLPTRLYHFLTRAFSTGYFSTRHWLRWLGACRFRKWMFGQQTRACLPCVGAICRFLSLHRSRPSWQTNRRLEGGRRRKIEDLFAYRYVRYCPDRAGWFDLCDEIVSAMNTCRARWHIYICVPMLVLKVPPKHP